MDFLRHRHDVVHLIVVEVVLCLPELFPLVLRQGVRLDLPAVEMSADHALVAHSLVAQPSAGKMSPILAQATFTDEIDRHESSSGKVAEPVVTVSSVYLPLSLAVQVPVTSRDPVTGTVLQPKLARETSMSPDRVKQEDFTFQVPTTLPPQVWTSGQLAGWLVVPEPPPPALPPLPAPPVELPPAAGTSEARAAARVSPGSTSTSAARHHPDKSHRADESVGSVADQGYPRDCGRACRLEAGNRHLVVGRRPQGDCIEDLVVLASREADVRRFTLGRRADAAATHLRRPLATLGPGARGVDRLTVGLEPCPHGLEDVLLLLRERAVRHGRGVEQQETVLADPVNQYVNEGLGRVVLHSLRVAPGRRAQGVFRQPERLGQSGLARPLLLMDLTGVPRESIIVRDNDVFAPLDALAVIVGEIIEPRGLADVVHVEVVPHIVRLITVYQLLLGSMAALSREHGGAAGPRLTRGRGWHTPRRSMLLRLRQRHVQLHPSVTSLQSLHSLESLRRAHNEARTQRRHFGNRQGCGGRDRRKGDRRDRDRRGRRLVLHCLHTGVKNLCKALAEIGARTWSSSRHRGCSSAET
jgi:hypothetical protein